MTQTYNNESQRDGIYTFTIKEDGSAEVSIADSKDKIYGPFRIIQIEAHYEYAVAGGKLILNKTSPDQETDPSDNPVECILTEIDHVGGVKYYIESDLRYLILAEESISVKTTTAITAGTKTIKITYDRKNLR